MFSVTDGLSAARVQSLPAEEASASPHAAVWRHKKEHEKHFFTADEVPEQPLSFLASASNNNNDRFGR